MSTDQYIMSTDSGLCATGNHADAEGSSLGHFAKRLSGAAIQWHRF